MFSSIVSSSQLKNRKSFSYFCRASYRVFQIESLYLSVNSIELFTVRSTIELLQLIVYIAPAERGTVRQYCTEGGWFGVPTQCDSRWTRVAYVMINGHFRLRRKWDRATKPVSHTNGNSAKRESPRLHLAISSLLHLHPSLSSLPPQLRYN